MTDNPRATMGGNNPPDPLDEATAPFSDSIEEAQNWLDGTQVESAEQMKAVDALTKDVKAAKKAADDARKAEGDPYRLKVNEINARYKPTIDDLDRITKGLIEIVGAFKLKEAERKEAERSEAERKAREADDAARKAAQDAARSDIEAQRAADQAKRAAEDARKKAAAASKDTVKGLRKVTRHEITDHRALLHYIAANHREDVTTFIEEWARKNHKSCGPVDGLKVWEEREAF